MWFLFLFRVLRPAVFSSGFSAAILALCYSARGQVNFVPLGDLPGGAFSSAAVQISDDGEVVAGVSESQFSVLDGFRWTALIGMHRLGDLPGGTVTSLPQGISSDGAVVVGDSQSAIGFEAYVWTPGTGLFSIGTLVGGSGEGVAIAVSGNGAVVGGSVNMPNGDKQAFVWTAGSGMRGLESLPGATRAGITGLSHDGRVGCGTSISSLGFEAVLWIENAGFMRIGDLPGGILQSTGTDISGDGRVIVGTSVSSRGTEAYRWTALTGMAGLGDVSGGTFSSGARGVSQDGWRIVGQGNDENGAAAFLWDPIQGTRSLRNVLKDYGFDLPGWTFGSANDISADGRTIVGSARNPAGDPEGFLARIPPFCYADCDQSTAVGTLDLQDFLCYQQRFLTADLYSDCNQDGSHDIFDFLCFQDHFFEGCGS